MFPSQSYNTQLAIISRAAEENALRQAFDDTFVCSRVIEEHKGYEIKCSVRSSCAKTCTPNLNHTVHTFEDAPQ